MVHIDTTTRPGALRLAIRGQLDLTAESAFDRALCRAAHCGRRIELDLGEVDFIDGSGLCMLIDAQRRARRVGQRLAIMDASRPVRRLVEITGTADRLPPLGASPGRQRITAVDVDGDIAAHRAFVGGSRVG